MEMEETSGGRVRNLSSMGGSGVLSHDLLGGGGPVTPVFQAPPPPTPEEAANLKALEGLMDEFFSVGVANLRKAEIERMLEQFGQQV